MGVTGSGVCQAALSVWRKDVVAKREARVEGGLNEGVTTGEWGWGVGGAAGSGVEGVSDRSGGAAGSSKGVVSEVGPAGQEGDLPVAGRGRVVHPLRAGRVLQAGWCGTHPLNAGLVLAE